MRLCSALKQSCQDTAYDIRHRAGESDGIAAAPGLWQRLRARAAGQGPQGRARDDPIWRHRVGPHPPGTSQLSCAMSSTVAGPARLSRKVRTVFCSTSTGLLAGVTNYPGGPHPCSLSIGCNCWVRPGCCHPSVSRSIEGMTGLARLHVTSTAPCSKTA